MELRQNFRHAKRYDDCNRKRVLFPLKLKVIFQKSAPNALPLKSARDDSSRHELFDWSVGSWFLDCGVFSVAVALREVTGRTHWNIMHQTHGFPANFDRHFLAVQRLLHRIRETFLRFVQCERRHGGNITPIIRLRQAGKKPSRKAAVNAPQSKRSAKFEGAE
jgi:hypothetical protein